MPSLLLTVFVVQLAIHLINSIGAATLNDLLWVLYNKAPTSTSRAVGEQAVLRREVVRLRTEMNSTSSQDEFAKWAKLRRQHDKVLADYEKKTSSLKSSKATFDSSTTAVRWASTNGVRLFLQFWYAKQALFWVPQGWLPFYVEWLLAFPRAPRGSISVQVWSLACASIIKLVSEAVVAVYALGTQSKVEGEKRQAHKVGSGTSTPDRKKEL
ncbi:MAG: hypothetical protein M1819_006000 [Sarea resinae]|nr:MAG: hypothetical protein M1819_006000 [Sarea resinae]